MAGGASPSQRISVLLGLSVAACIALEVTSEIPGMQRRRWRERRPGIRPGAQDGEAPGVGGSYQPKELPRVQRQCDRPFDCSSGCIAVIGNGWSMTRGQAAMASQCEQVYRANYMDSMNSCFTKTSHCFFHWIPNGFVAVRNGVPPQPSTTIGNSNRRANPYQPPFPSPP